MKLAVWVSMLVTFLTTFNSWAQDLSMKFVPPPLTPAISVNKSLQYGSTYKIRVVARLGGDSNLSRQGKIVVSTMAQIIEQYPKADSYGVSYSLPKGQYFALSYHPAKKSMIFSSAGYSRYYSYIYLSDFNYAASRNFDVQMLFDEIENWRRFRQQYFYHHKEQSPAR